MKENFTGLFILGFVLALIAGALLAYTAFPRVVEIEKQVLVPYNEGSNAQIAYNDTAIKTDLLAIKSEVLKDSDWKTKAQALALAEMEDRDYRDVYNALVDLNISIVDKGDISSVIIKNTEISNIDTADKDAIVTQELKVYYENSDGDDKKAYLTLETKIVENEVDDTTYELT